MKGVTAYQLEILQKVGSAGPGLLLDFDQLLESLSWAPSKESAQFTIRALVQKGLLAKSPVLQLRRGRKRVCYLLTGDGKKVLDPRPAISVSAEFHSGAIPPEVEEVSDFCEGYTPLIEVEIA